MARLHRVHESTDAVRPRALRPAAVLLTMGLLLTGCAGADGEQTEDGQSAAASTAQDGGATASTTSSTNNPPVPSPQAYGSSGRHPAASSPRDMPTALSNALETTTGMPMRATGGVANSSRCSTTTR